MSGADDPFGTEGEKLDGFISTITLPNGKKYGLRCAIVEVQPIVCPKCGASFDLKYGHGKCDYCATYYATEFKVVEEKV